MKFLYVLSFFALCGSAVAQNPNGNRLMQLDKDGDGKLSKEEVPERMKARFDMIDGDSDGKITREELAAAARKLNQMRQANDRPNRRGGPATLPEGVTLKEDIAYREGNPKWKLDLYLPEGEAPEGGRPGMVVVHGGGWKSGDKQGGVWSSTPAEYAANGYVAIGVNYRLHPEVGMLDCIADVKCAVRWLRAHAEEYGLDPQRIGAYGNSAGAHLVSMLGLTNAEDGLEGDGPYADQSSQVQAVCASATPADFLNWGGKGAGDFPQLAEGEGTAEERGTKASPVTYAREKAPPFLLIHAKDDRTVPYAQGKSLSEKLEAVGADVTLMTYDDGGHGVFNAKAKETKPAMEAFFERTLKAKE